jgi:hypothetical protein
MTFSKKNASKWSECSLIISTMYRNVNPILNNLHAAALKQTTFKKKIYDLNTWKACLHLKESVQGTIYFFNEFLIV